MFCAAWFIEIEGCPSISIKQDILLSYVGFIKSHLTIMTASKSQHKFRWNHLLAIIYVCIVSCSISVIFMDSKDAFSGLLAVIVTLPWSIASVFCVSFLFPHIFDHSALPGVLLIVLSGAINTWFLVYIPARLKRANQSNSQQDDRANDPLRG